MGFLDWWNAKLDQWIAKMERPAREEGRAEGIEIGIEKGKQRVRDWEIRKAEAEAQDLPFDEPLPGSAPQLLGDQQIKRQP